VVNPRTQTPIRALATASSLGLLFVAWGYVSSVTGKGGDAFLLLITATATLPFIVYFLTVLAYVVRRTGRGVVEELWPGSEAGLRIVLALGLRGLAAPGPGPG